VIQPVENSSSNGTSKPTYVIDQAFSSDKLTALKTLGDRNMCGSAPDIRSSNRLSRKAGFKGGRLRWRLWIAGAA
jgi:hypothetical protein